MRKPFAPAPLEERGVAREDIVAEGGFEGFELMVAEIAPIGAKGEKADITKVEVRLELAAQPLVPARAVEVAVVDGRDGVRRDRGDHRRGGIRRSDLVVQRFRVREGGAEKREDRGSEEGAHGKAPSTPGNLASST